MSLSLSRELVNEDLDNSNVLEEQVSSHFISDEQSCLFDILSSTQAGHAFNSSLLEDIDLDLQCEDDVDCSNNAVFEEMAEGTLHAVYNCNGTSYSPSVATENCCKRRPLIPQHCLIKDQSNKSQNVDDSSRQFTFSFPVLHCETNKLLKVQNLTDQKFVTCRNCSMQFSSKEALFVHNKDQHVKKEALVQECTYCQINFKNKKSLAKHLKFHKEKQEEKYEAGRESSENCVFLCESCPYVGKTRARLNDHIKAKHTLERNVYFCEKCNFACLHEQTLTLHHQRHEGDPKFACDQCGKLFFTMGILKRHAHTHNKSRIFLCQFQHCGKSFNIKSRLTDHIRTVHKNKKHPDTHSPSDSSTLITCLSDKHFDHSKQPDCSIANDFKQNNSSKFPEFDTSIPHDTLTFTSSDIFIYDIILPEDKINHFNSIVNKGNNLNSCSSNKVVVNSNMIMHKSQTSCCSDSKISNSDCCDSQTYLSKNIVEDRKFACTWYGCDKTFRDNYNLFMHMCTHTGEMQRACSLCRYRCVQKSAMDAHMKTHYKVIHRDV